MATDTTQTDEVCADAELADVQFSAQSLRRDVDEVVAFYMLMRLDGQSHNFAAMAACRCPPGTNHSDRAYMQGVEMGGVSTEVLANKYAKVYKKLTGKSVPRNYRYSRSLARFPGDPKAWVSSVGEFKARAKETGGSCEELGVKGVTDLAPVPSKVPLATDLVARRMKREMAQEKGRKYSRKELQNMRERIVDTHSYDTKKAVSKDKGL